MRLDRLSEAAKVNTDAMRSAQEEIIEYRRQLQARTTELEALKSTKDSLERQRSELEDRHQADIASYQVGRGGAESQTASPSWVTLEKSLSFSEQGCSGQGYGPWSQTYQIYQYVFLGMRSQEIYLYL